MQRAQRFFYLIENIFRPQTRLIQQRKLSYIFIRFVILNETNCNEESVLNIFKSTFDFNTSYSHQSRISFLHN